MAFINIKSTSTIQNSSPLLIISVTFALQLLCFHFLSLDPYPEKLVLPNQSHSFQTHSFQSRKHHASNRLPTFSLDASTCPSREPHPATRRVQTTTKHRRLPWRRELFRCRNLRSSRRSTPQAGRTSQSSTTSQVHTTTRQWGLPRRRELFQRSRLRSGRGPTTQAQRRRIQYNISGINIVTCLSVIINQKTTRALMLSLLTMTKFSFRGESENQRRRSCDGETDRRKST